MADDGDDPASSPSNSKSLLGWLRTLADVTDDAGARKRLGELIETRTNGDREAATLGRRMIDDLFALGDRWIEDAMVPRADIEAAQAGETIEAIVARFLQAGHSRLPIYTETLDDAAGMLHVKDLIPFWGQKGTVDLTKVLRPVLFAPPAMRVPELLMRMQGQGIHMALVVDEYGGIDGLVTLEDLIEEIVGDIEERSDRDEEPMIVAEADGTLLVDARVTVEDLADKVEIDLLDDDDEEIDTVGGLVYMMTDRIPKIGEQVRHRSGLCFTVVDGDRRRIKRLRVARPPAD